MGGAADGHAEGARVSLPQSRHRSGGATSTSGCRAAARAIPTTTGSPVTLPRTPTATFRLSSRWARRAARRTPKVGAGCGSATSSRGMATTATPSSRGTPAWKTTSSLRCRRRAGLYAVLVHRVRDHRRRDRRDGHRAHRCSGRGARQWNRRRSATRHRKRPRQPHNRGSDGEPVGEERPGRGRVDAGPTRRLVRATRHRRQAGIRVERRPGRTGRACRSARGRRRGAQLRERRHHSPDGRNQYERERPR